MIKEPNLEVNIAGVKIKNPVTVASGTFGSGAEYCDSFSFLICKLKKIRQRDRKSVV